ncbi:hypothetical protein JV173_04355 [Acholeplasma equirhinis]|uniref:hypothetical protein n=1 Tax=Acholeplasma equirhinis TaxID=555393 RepID=UPI00197AA723|nr:hypothetical protein [Acholeplasma equirhinis]MBN3490742.1 hypothetical protein [Acholeplasma equirhinis]
MLTIWAILIDVIAYLITSWIASSTVENYFTENVFIVPSFAIIYLVYHRWGKFGFVTHGISLILQLILYSNQIFQGLPYPFMIIISYAIFLVVLLKIKYLKNDFMNSWLGHLISFILIYICMLSVEWLVGIIFGLHLSYLGILFRHTTNLVISTLVIIIMSLQKDLITDMKSLLIEQVKQKEEDYL